jgi:hypothetical protein
MDDVTVDPVTAWDFEDALNDMRFDAFEHGKPQAVLPAGLGFPSFNAPSVEGTTLYHVMKLKYLWSIVDAMSPLHTEISLPIGKDPPDIDRFLDDWNGLAENERTFTPAGFLGRPIVWFTDAVGADAARSIAAAHNMPAADAFCETLGLGHHQQSEWVILLHIPGAAIQKAGHYRPLFCDAVTHRYFMAHSSRPGISGGPWGQTADLRALEEGDDVYDGAPERVSRQLETGHFGGEKIYVELLGSLSRRTYPAEAPRRLADGVWQRRRSL